MNAERKPLQIDSGNLLHFLRLWSREFGERPEHLVEGWDEGEGSGLYQSAHPLARAAEYAPGSRQAVLDRRVTFRDGSDRRRHMARELGPCGVRVVPMAYVDAVAGSPTRADMRTPRHVTRPPVPAEVLAIQRCVMDMIESASASAWGHALQIHYCTSGDLKAKSEAFALRIGTGATVRAYRTCVEQAKIYLLGKLGA
jgi:hypothetical protein